MACGLRIRPTTSMSRPGEPTHDFHAHLPRQGQGAPAVAADSRSEGLEAASPRCHAIREGNAESDMDAEVTTLASRPPISCDPPEIACRLF